MTFSAVVGCAMRNAIKSHPWLAIPIAVALSIIVMELTRTVHPPGMPLTCLTGSTIAREEQVHQGLHDCHSTNAQLQGSSACLPERSLQVLLKSWLHGLLPTFVTNAICSTISASRSIFGLVDTIASGAHIRYSESVS